MQPLVSVSALAPESAPRGRPCEDANFRREHAEAHGPTAATGRIKLRRINTMLTGWAPPTDFPLGRLCALSLQEPPGQTPAC